MHTSAGMFGRLRRPLDEAPGMACVGVLEDGLPRGLEGLDASMIDRFRSQQAQAAMAMLGVVP